MLDIGFSFYDKICYNLFLSCQKKNPCRVRGLDEPTLVIWLLFFDNDHSFEKFYDLRANFTIITSTSRWLKMFPSTVYVSSNKGALVHIWLFLCGCVPLFCWWKTEGLGPTYLANLASFLFGLDCICWTLWRSLSKSMSFRPLLSIFFRISGNWPW